MAMMNKTLTMTKLMNTSSTKDVGGKGAGEYGRATRESVAALALLPPQHVGCTADVQLCT